MKGKKRIDLLLFERGLVPSRERAKTSVMSGLVFVGGQRVDKPGTPVPVDSDIEVRGQAIGYVSRGGLKLEKALLEFAIDVTDAPCLDIGASTGGFTDCLLKNGARKVYAVDVGYGQLAWSLRVDPRVVVMERTNIRFVTADQIPEAIQAVSIDVSFISLRLVLPVVAALTRDDADIVCLIKPQFEAGREKVGKKGVIRDPGIHTEVLFSFLEDAAAAGYSVRGLTFSPVRGPEGNIEFLAHLVKGKGHADFDVADVVRSAHEDLTR